MTIKAQIAMTMALDKCIGCHTCSITCKNTWTNRSGAEYIWFNDVETKPGPGYPRAWEDQARWRGGWVLKRGKLRLAAGGRLQKLFRLFYNPDLPQIDDYYEPWTYDYETLTARGAGPRQPVAHPRSSVSGEPLVLRAGPNWDDDLAGAPTIAREDPALDGLDASILLEYAQSFMMYLPRICEHCLNPSCVASCPSGAIYKREEDGIVLVDEENCRAWRFCVSGCPYKKVYFNWKTHKAEKCTFCYPRVEAGQPTICSETCPGRLRYLGVVLYDVDRVKAAASVENPQDLVGSQLALFRDANDPAVVAQAERDGIPHDWIEAARRSPVYDLAIRWKIALPLHPEFRTLPMVWYVPPLSPLLNRVDPEGREMDPRKIFPEVDQMRIPIRYLANLLSAGNTDIVREVLRKLVGLRVYMRAKNLGVRPDPEALRASGLTEAEADAMYRLLAIAKYEDRYVIPTSHRERGLNLHSAQGTDGLPFAQTQYNAEVFHGSPLATEPPSGMAACPVGAGCAGCGAAPRHGSAGPPRGAGASAGLVSIAPLEEAGASADGV